MQFVINYKTITCTDRTNQTTDCILDEIASFTFDDTWQDYTSRTAVFNSGTVQRYDYIYTQNTDIYPNISLTAKCLGN